MDHIKFLQEQSQLIKPRQQLSKSISHVSMYQYNIYQYHIKDHMHNLMVRIQCKRYLQSMTKKQMTLNKASRSEIESFLRTLKLLEVRYLSDAVNAAAARYPKNSVEL